MASYERRVLETVRVEFHVPATPPWGAPWVEVMKALNAARSELVQAGVVNEVAELADDQIQIEPRDDVIVVSYERRTSAPAPTEVPA